MKRCVVVVKTRIGNVMTCVVMWEMVSGREELGCLVLWCRLKVRGGEKPVVARLTNGKEGEINGV